MKGLLRAIGRLATWQKLVLGSMAILVLLTWLAVCLVLGSYGGL